MKSGNLFIAALLIAVLMLAGCGRVREESSYGGGAPGQTGSSSNEDKQLAGPGSQSGLTKSAETSKSKDESSGLPTKRMIIYTVNMSMVVKDFDSSAKLINTMVDESNGYVVSSQLSSGDDGGGKYGTFTIKVPAESLTSFTDKISQIGEVKSLNKNGEDVTEQWVDLSARLQNMKIEEKHYQDMYDKAKNVDEMLKVRNELGRVRGDIEALQGKLNYLKTNTSMATIVLSLSQKGHATPKSFWDFKGTAGDALTVLKYLIKLVIALAIYGVIVFIPFGMIIWLIVRALRLIRGKGVSRGSEAKKRVQPPAGHDRLQEPAAQGGSGGEESRS
jgi:F0F1-type ATP synthase assembly protein I